jgi:hypothetical protein
MHDRNGTPLQPGELVRWRCGTADIDVEVMHAGPGGTVVIAVPIPSFSGKHASVLAAFDQVMASEREATGAPSGCLATAAPPDHIERLGN